jgi:hypothetical protein
LQNLTRGVVVTDVQVLLLKWLVARRAACGQADDEDDGKQANRKFHKISLIESIRTFFLLAEVY